MQHIGIFADNFNPINMGQIEFLKIIQKKHKLNRIIILINNKKISQTSNDIPIEKKKALCKIAIKDLNFIYLYPEKVNKFNTIFHILHKIQKENPNCELNFIVWPTELPYLSSIYNTKKLAQISNIICAAPLNMITTLSNNPHKISITPAEFDIITSRNLRIMLSLKKDCSKFISKEMLKYINENDIYVGKKFLLSECSSICKQNTSKIRFLHCKLVSKAARDLAKIYNEDELDAAIAGLLHDVMKEKSQEYMLNIFNFYNFKLNETQQTNPKVWHGLAGSLYIEKVLKIDIKHIINAVKYHTVPRKNMTLFEKIIFIADRISDDRIYKDVNVLRNLAKKDLNAAVLYSLKNTISSLLKKENTISTPTIECYNNLILKKRRKSKYGNKN